MNKIVIKHYFKSKKSYYSCSSEVSSSCRTHRTSHFYRCHYFFSETASGPFFFSYYQRKFVTDVGIDWKYYISYYIPSEGN